MKKFAFACAAATTAALAVLTMKASAQTYRQVSRFEMVKAYCEQVADGLTDPPPGVVIDGRTAATTGVTAGLGLLGIAASLAHHANVYDRCMISYGFARN